MDDLISRMALLKSIREVSTSPLNEWDTMGVLNIVNKQPTVEAVPVVHGKWTNEYINRYGHPCHCCSVCGFHASHQDKNFCPECGADMRKEK